MKRLRSKKTVGHAQQNKKSDRFWFSGNRYTCPAGKKEEFIEGLRSIAEKTRGNTECEEWKTGLAALKKSFGIEMGKGRCNIFSERLCSSADNHLQATPKGKTKLMQKGRHDDHLLAQDDEKPPVVEAITAHSKIEGGRKFEVTRRIGKGTYGTVYRGLLYSETVATSTRTVAIKKIPKDFQDPLNNGIVFREVAALRQVSTHRNIVELLAFVETEFDYLFFFDIFTCDVTWIIKRKMERFEVKACCRQLIDAVSYVHSLKLIHRDVKPRNILYRANSDPQFALCDFGLSRHDENNIDESELEIARRLAPDSAYTSNVVTLYYRAPEILLKKGKYDVHIDDWALGCSFAEMEISEPLFNVANEAQLLRGIFSKMSSPEHTCQTLSSQLKALNGANTGTMFLKQLGSRFGHAFASFLAHLLCVNPSKRNKLEAAASDWLQTT